MVDLSHLDEARETREDARLDAALARRAPAVVTPVKAPAPIAPPAEVAVPALETLALPETLLGPYSYLAGSAGTGKTFLAKALAAQLPGTVIAATTGIAAVNLGEGTTINALAGYFDTASLKESFTAGHLTARLGKLWRSGVRRILLDEVSMMPALQLTYLTRALEELGGRGYVMDEQLEDEIDAADGAFSGIALTLIGDFAQLPPVSKRGEPPSHFAFESVEWPKYAAHTHTLTKIWRQTDRPFVEALQAARRGERDAVVDYFGPRLATATDDNFVGVTLMATNEAVDRHNALQLDKVKGPREAFLSSRWGITRGDWKNIPETMTLKIGALVMILANERTPRTDPDDPMSAKLIYANGDLGTVETIDAERARVYVRLTRNDEVVEIQWVCRQNTRPLEPGERTKLKAEGNEHLLTPNRKQVVIGEVTYLPLRVAYASTVHKSQGLTLDNVQVVLRERFFESPGMCYVALSRARSAGGLRIVGTPDGLRQRCTINAKVAAWL